MGAPALGDRPGLFSSAPSLSLGFTIGTATKSATSFLPNIPLILLRKRDGTLFAVVNSKKWLAPRSALGAKAKLLSA
jgi:hypothetical protein